MLEGCIFEGLLAAMVNKSMQSVTLEQFDCTENRTHVVRLVDVLDNTIEYEIVDFIKNTGTYIVEIKKEK